VSIRSTGHPGSFASSFMSTVSTYFGQQKYFTNYIVRKYAISDADSFFRNETSDCVYERLCGHWIIHSIHLGTKVTVAWSWLCCGFVWNFFNWQSKTRQSNWKHGLKFKPLINFLFIELLYKSNIGLHDCLNGIFVCLTLFQKRGVLICSRLHPIIRKTCVLRGKLKTCVCIAPNVRDLFDGKSHIFGCRIVCQVEFSSRCLAERKTWNFSLLNDKERKNIKKVINTLEVHRSPGLHHS